MTDKTLDSPEQPAYALKITVRNARILRAIESAGYASQAAFARAIGGI